MTELQTEIVIDATWLSRRNFYASGKEQDQEKIIISILMSVLKIIKDGEYASNIVMCFDRGTYRYRDKKIFKEYKASREYDNSYEALWEAQNRLIPLLRNLGIDTIQVGGIEADDLGYYYANKTDRDTLLITKDYDWYISINETTTVLQPKLNADGDKFTDHVSICEQFGLEHHADYLYYKALEGDGSDEIAGIAVSESDRPKYIKMFKEYLAGTTWTEDIEILTQLQYNVRLMRLDMIMDDQEVIKLIIEDENKTNNNRTPNKVLNDELGLGKYPSYMMGVLGKYNKLHPKGK